MSSTMAAWGKVEIALRTGDMLPLGWTIDPDGNPITDPREDEKKKGAMVMLGGPGNLEYIRVSAEFDDRHAKQHLSGFCLSPGTFSISALSAPAPILRRHENIRLCPASRIKKGMDRMIEVYHNLPKAKGVKNITIPGELEWALVQDRKKNGIRWMR